jgi:hypothetical protein
MNSKRKTLIESVSKGLFVRSGLEASTVELIATDPSALDAVMSRISEQQAVTSDVVSPRRMWRQRAFAGFASLLIFAVFGYFMLVSDGPIDSASKIDVEVPAVTPAGVRPITPPDGVVSEQTASRAPQFYSASLRERAPKKRPVRPQATARSEADAVEPAEFVSLGLRSTAEQASGGGRVVRVDLPAASLFAMGIDVPIENGAESVRADLIIGPDGVTRAVKLVE